MISLAFWVFDFRNRQLYWVCQNAGAALEKQRGLSGSYTALNGVHFGTKHRLTHGFGINLLVASVVAAVVGILYLHLLWVCTFDHWVPAIVIVTLVLLVVCAERVGDRNRNTEEKLATDVQTPKK
jgi:undecaprenyl pyrophosphate phosphatase UppP